MHRGTIAILCATMMVLVCQINGDGNVEYCVGDAGHSAASGNGPYRMMILTNRYTSDPKWDDWRYRLCFKVHNPEIDNTCPHSQMLLKIHEVTGEKSRTLIGQKDIQARGINKLYSFCAHEPTADGECEEENKVKLNLYCIGTAGTINFPRPNLTPQELDGILHRDMIFEGNATCCGFVKDLCFCATRS